MDNSYDNYQSPLSTRYASKQMQYLFSQNNKFKTWRKLWIALAKAEKKLGINISDEQISELEKFKEQLNLDMAKKREIEVKHDVMAHIYAYGEQCPKAKPIIHLGATSCYVGDNTDVIIMTEGLKLLKSKLAFVLKSLCDFADKYKSIATLSFTHFQPAQPTTVGKRATLWIQDLMLDFEQMDFQIKNMKLLGSKGTTGTQASFLELFNGDVDKVMKLDSLIATELGFQECFAVSGQTYTRKLDSQVLSVLSGIAQSAAKFSNDIRLLQHLKEIEEPFAKNQVGSSAMAYKRNPMRCERMAALARYLIVDSLNPMITASTQWLERTLDDSANKRISIPEAFLSADAILNLYLDITNGLVVYENVIQTHLTEELPFMMTENIMMKAVKNGSDRQQAHEHIRMHSIASAKVIKESGKKNDLLDRIASDPFFKTSRAELENLANPDKYTGLAQIQTEQFLMQINQKLKEYDEFNFKSLESQIDF